MMSMSVCLSVCLSVHNHILGTTRPIFTQFFMLVTCGIVICYVLPVLWMPPCLFISQGSSTSPLRCSAHAALGLAISCVQ